MKRTLYVCIAMIALAGFTTHASAQETASATATATIVTPISITNDQDMNFGNVAVLSTAGGTVILSPAGLRTPTDGVSLPATNGVISAASFTVSGMDGYAYSITLPATAITLSSGANTMTVNAFTSTPTAAAGVLAGGEEILNVGATLNVGAGQPAGTYVSDVPFDVTVNYN